MNTETPQNSYLAELAAAAAALRETTRQIADALTVVTSNQWTHRPRLGELGGMYSSEIMIGPDEQVLIIRRSDLLLRLDIYGSFEAAHDYRPRGEKHEISVSAERPAADIARDIAHRLLPAYSTSLAHARAAMVVWETMKAAQHELAAELRDLARGYPVTGHPDHTPGVQLDVVSDLSVSLLLSGLTAQQARAIIGVLRTPADKTTASMSEAEESINRLSEIDSAAYQAALDAEERWHAPGGAQDGERRD